MIFLFIRPNIIALRLVLVFKANINKAHVTYPHHNINLLSYFKFQSKLITRNVLMSMQTYLLAMLSFAKLLSKCSHTWSLSTSLLKMNNVSGIPYLCEEQKKTCFFRAQGLYQNTQVRKRPRSPKQQPQFSSMDMILTPFRCSN